MSYTRAGYGAASFGQEPGPSRGAALGSVAAVAVLGAVVYWALNSSSSSGSSGYYDHRLGKWVSRNRRSRRRH